MSYNYRYKALITGASGFLGRVLVNILGKRGDVEILAVPGRTEGYDLTKIGQIENLIDQFKPTLVFNLIAEFDGELDQMRKCNVDLPNRILRHIKFRSFKTKVILVGSAAEYGAIDPTDNPVAESAPLRPLTNYGLTKSWQSALCAYYAEQGVNVSIGRLFNLKGPNAPERSLVGAVQSQIDDYKHGFITEFEFGHLEHERDYISVECAARDLVLIGEAGVSGEIYNIGSGYPVKVSYLVADMLIEAGLDPNAVPVNQSAETKQYKTSVVSVYSDISKITRLRRLRHDS